jgi:dsRNA-specific ribonuclease
LPCTEGVPSPDLAISFTAERYRSRETCAAGRIRAPCGWSRPESMRFRPLTTLSLARLTRPSSIRICLRIQSYRTFQTTVFRHQDSSGTFLEDESVTVIVANVEKMQLPNPLPELPPIPSEVIQQEVFAHSSSITFAGDTSESPQSNERLEFLGDSYLNFCISAILFRAFPTMAPGDLTRVRSGIVSNANLNIWARAYGFHNQLRINRSMQHLNIPESGEKIIADCFEAYIGGVITTHPEGNKLVFTFLDTLVQPTLVEQRKILEDCTRVDKMSVSKLYQLATKNKASLHFQFVDTTFQGALDRWEAICYYNEEVIGRAKAKNQQDAKHLAASEALEAVTRVEMIREDED